MFLTTPTLEELKQSDLPDLIDMLSKQATEYSRLIKIEGITSKTIADKRPDPEHSGCNRCKKRLLQKSCRLVFAATCI